MKFNTPLANQFRNGVTKAFLDTIRAKKSVEPFAFDDMVSGHIGYWEMSKNPELAQWFEEVPGITWPHIFEGDKTYLAKVKFHAAILPVKGTSKSLVVYRRRGGGSLVHKGGVMAIFDTTEHQFKPATGKVFHFDHGVDFFEWDGRVYICDQRRFESLTNIRTVTASKAKECLKEIGGKLDIQVANLDQLQDVIATKALYAKKLASALEHDVIQKLTGVAMADRIVTKGLPITWRETNNVYSFDLDPDDANQVREFVYLVTDYYLRSPVTKIEYRVPAKYPAN